MHGQRWCIRAAVSFLNLVPRGCVLGVKKSAIKNMFKQHTAHAMGTGLQPPPAGVPPVKPVQFRTTCCPSSSGDASAQALPAIERFRVAARP